MLADNSLLLVDIMTSFEHDADMTGVQDQDEKKQEEQKTEHAHGHSHSHADGHVAAKIVALGTVTLGGATFAIDREGQIEAGKKTEFGVELIGSTGTAVVPSEAWLANPDGSKVCDPVPGEGHDQHWHFNVEPDMPVKKSKFVLRVGEEEAFLDFAPGSAPSNDGILSVFKASHAPEWRGFLELKLHGDAGDLELWLYTSAGYQTGWQVSAGKPTPFDVPKETVIRLSFPTHDRNLELRVRNADKNEDEGGISNMRGGSTNYFIFPGDSGQDPKWLMGEKWRGLVTVSFEVDDKSYAADPFVLVPHEAL